MTASEHRAASTAPSIPRPREAEPDRVPDRPASQQPWPEPWRSTPGARPRREYWDMTTGGWRACTPVSGRGE
jgi:hypothetical protein